MMIQANSMAQKKLGIPGDNEPGPQGPARSGKAFDDPEFEPTGPMGPNPEAPIGPVGPIAPIGPFGPVGPREPLGAQLQDGSNNQGPEQNQNQEPVDGDPYDNGGGHWVP